MPYGTLPQPRVYYHVTTLACQPGAISVGATTLADDVWGYSNSSPALSLLATSYGGTSHAAPRVSAAWAIAKQAIPDASVSEVLAALKTTGKSVTDPKSGVTTPRIRILAGLDAMGAPGIWSGPIDSTGAFPCEDPDGKSGDPVMLNQDIYWVLKGSPGPDDLTSDPDKYEVICGLGGDDHLVGDTHDIIYGHDGADAIEVGTAASEPFAVAAGTEIYAGADADTVKITMLSKNVVVHGGDGPDTIEVEKASSANKTSVTPATTPSSRDRPARRCGQAEATTSSRRRARR